MRHYVFGGRFGDVCHSIPAAYEYFRRTGERVRFTSSEEFGSILEGCDYLEPHRAPVPWTNIQDIVQWAQRRFPGDEVVNMACYGKDYSPGYESFSYLRDSWKLSRCPSPAETVPLVFDRRNKFCEDKLVALHLSSTEPNILVSTHGKSSPFNQTNALLDDVRRSHPEAHVVDLSRVKADRVYDLLGLFERASALVTIDTLHLHLSAAVPTLPVFALACDGHTRWNRSDWRPQQVFRCTYAQYSDRRPLFRQTLTSMANSTPQIIHVWSHMGPRSEDTARRMAVAHQSWETEAAFSGNWTTIEATEATLPRLMRHDGNLPYVKDLFDLALRQATSDDDILSLSNSDVGCVHGITGQILDACRAKGSAYTHRFDLHGEQIQKPILAEWEVLRRCKWYPGSDWFFVTARWWRAHRAEVPDMVVGREFWDCVFRQLLKKHGTQEIHSAVWHEKHASLWELPGNRENLPGNKHNRALAQQFFRENSSDDKDPWRSTWNIKHGVTAPIKDPGNYTNRNLAPTGIQRSNLVFPSRLIFQPNRIRARIK